MFGLFKKKETKVYAPYNETARAIETATTMDECKSLGKIIMNLNPQQNVQLLKDKLCDKTFKIFLEQYGNKNI